MTQAERVRLLRKELSLTQSDFGKRVGVGKTAISKIEKNEKLSYRSNVQFNLP